MHLPVEAIARTIDVARRTGEGKSMGYAAPPSSLFSSAALTTSLPLAAAAGEGESFWEDGNGGSPDPSTPSSPSGDDDARNWNALRRSEAVATAAAEEVDSNLGGDSVDVDGEKDSEVWNRRNADMSNIANPFVKLVIVQDTEL